MLRRLIQRPSTRSVAAAAWPSIPTTQLLHGGSSSRHLQPPEHDAQATTPKPPSLFEKLFPDEAKQTRTQQLDKLPKSAWASHTLDEESPPLAAPASDTEHLDDSPSSSSKTTAPLRAQSMLILSAASKQLLESDFIRLCQRGAHVEGWVAGIQRVVQAQDPDTLQPLGHYFILFDSDAAAAAYRHEVERLWVLAKAQDVPGVRRGVHRHLGVVKRGVNGRGGDDAEAKALASFTLVPPSQRYYLRQSESRGSRRDRLDGIDLGGASFVDRLRTKAGSQHLVLVTVDGGRVSVDTLRRAIEDDGINRNLPWRVTDLEKGILPFGKSVLKKHDVIADVETAGSSDIERNLLEQAGRTLGAREGPEEDETPAAAVGEDRQHQHRRYLRFIVPFTDGPEAHRFVRNWHRRQLKLRMNADSEDQASWDETRILNASVMW